MGYEEYLLNVLDDQIEYKNTPFKIYTSKQEILDSDTIPSSARYISIQEYEDMIVESAKIVIDRFAASSNNQDVYAMVLYIDIEGGDHGLSFGTEHAYQHKLTKR